MSVEWKAGDWCIYEMKIVHINKIEPYVEYTDGVICGSGGRLKEDFRPLTVRNKQIIESMDYYYDLLGEQDGSAGFNFPDIHRYFAQISRDAIDGDDEAIKTAIKKAQDFFSAARDYEKVIDGVRLFRPR